MKTKIGRPVTNKVSVNLRLDKEVAEWLKKRDNKSRFVNQMLLTAMKKEMEYE